VKILTNANEYQPWGIRNTSPLRFWYKQAGDQVRLSASLPQYFPSMTSRSPCSWTDTDRRYIDALDLSPWIYYFFLIDSWHKLSFIEKHMWFISSFIRSNNCTTLTLHETVATNWHWEFTITHVNSHKTLPFSFTTPYMSSLQHSSWSPKVTM